MVHEDRLESYRGNGWLWNSEIAQPFKESMAEVCPGTSGGHVGRVVWERNPGRSFGAGHAK